ncbi:MAG: hypothetical protein JRJ29_00645 [Deltaproteobacteria bacterium]|nr:hypothetical protein [Deltaproteobacteria bacterium]
MRKKGSVLVLAVMIAALAFSFLTPVAGIAEAKTKYVVAWYADPGAGMNPFRARAHSDYIFIPWIYEPLNIELWDGSIMPWLARSWGYDSSTMEWIFRLDERARWSDGKPLTAEDVKFTFDVAYRDNTILGNPTKKYVVGIRVVDKHTVAFKLNEPLAAFPATLGQAFIVPKHLWKDVPDVSKYDNPRPVGSGPFKFKEFKPRNYLALRNNENYWRGSLDIDELVVRVFANMQAEIVALKKGEVDFMPDLAGAENLLKSLEKDKNIEVKFGLTNNTFYVAPNYRRAPMRNKQFRYALDFAAPKERIVNVALAGYGQLPLMGYFSPVVKKWVNTKVTWKGLNMSEEARIRKANSILDSIGWKRGPDGIRVANTGEKLHYSIKCMNDPAFIRTAEMLKENWAKIGVKIDVQVHDRRTLYGGIVYGGKSTKDWDFLLHRSVLRPDPDHLAREYAPEPPQSWYNATAFAWENQPMQILLKRSRREMDPVKRIMMIKKFQEMFAEEMVVIPLAHKYMGFAYRTDRFVNTNKADVYTSMIALVNVVSMKLKK